MQALNHALTRLPNWPFYVLGPLPAIWLFWRALNNQLGADPIDTLIVEYGETSIQLLALTLLITPLKHLKINATKQKRPLGLLAFTYALFHLLVWLVLDQGLNLERIWTEIIKRPYITLGMIAFALMIPLALTSNNRALRKLGPKKWKRLHLLTYPLALIASFHFILVVKGWQVEPFIYFGIFATIVFLKRKSIQLLIKSK